MSTNTTSPTPYIRVGDACMDSAVLSACDGFDVAWLRRITPSDNIPGHRFLTDDEWQRLINLIDAAPVMLSLLKTVLADTQQYLRTEDVAGLHIAVVHNELDIKQAIEAATTGTSVSLDRLRSIS